MGINGSHYHNPDPLCRLIGPKNKVVVVNNEQVTALETWEHKAQQFQ